MSHSTLHIKITPPTKDPYREPILGPRQARTQKNVVQERRRKKNLRPLLLQHEEDKPAGSPAAGSPRGRSISSPHHASAAPSCERAAPWPPPLQVARSGPRGLLQLWPQPSSTPAVGSKNKLRTTTAVRRHRTTGAGPRARRVVPFGGPSPLPA